MKSMKTNEEDRTPFEEREQVHCSSTFDSETHQRSELESE